MRHSLLLTSPMASMAHNEYMMRVVNADDDGTMVDTDDDINEMDEEDEEDEEESLDGDEDDEV